MKLHHKLDEYLKQHPEEELNEDGLATAQHHFLGVLDHWADGASEEADRLRVMSISLHTIYNGHPYISLRSNIPDSDTDRIIQILSQAIESLKAKKRINNF